MTRKAIIRTRNFVLLALVQVLIFSQIHLFGYATASVFTIFLLKLPRHTTHNELMIWGFLFGIITDMFCNTPGIHSAAATAMAFVRNPILSIFTHKGLPDDFVPSARSIKWGGYIVYAVLCLSVYYVLLFMLELFTIRYLSALIISIIGSTILTMIFVVMVELFTPKK